MRDKENPLLPFDLPAGFRGRLVDHKIIDPDDGYVYYSLNESDYNDNDTPDRPEDPSIKLLEFFKTLRHHRAAVNLDKRKKQYLIQKKDFSMNSVDSEQLLEIAYANELALNRYESSDKFTHLKIAGSSFIEVAILTDDIDNRKDDERLALVDRGIACYKQAVEYIERKMKNDPHYIRYYIEAERAKLHIAFENVYKDIVTRELTDLTVAEITEMLEGAIQESTHMSESHGLSKKQRSLHFGFGGELISLSQIWSSYKKVGDTIAIPSSEGGGHGFFRKAETHDIVTMRQDEELGNWKNLHTYEVKRRLITQQMTDRYLSPIIQVQGRSPFKVHEPGIHLKNDPKHEAS